jgi:hypothetical protein
VPHCRFQLNRRLRGEIVGGQSTFLIENDTHDLIPTGLEGVNTFLSRATVNQLTVIPDIPATGYSFIAGSGVNADLSYVVGRGYAKSPVIGWDSELRCEG